MTPPQRLFLSWRQTIDKVGQLLGRGLVSKDDEMYDQQIAYLSSNQRRTHMVRFLCCFTVKK